MGSEREQIVEWLREKVVSMNMQIRAFGKTGAYMEAGLLDLGADTVKTVADAIERGDHLPTERTDNG